MMKIIFFFVEFVTKFINFSRFGYEDGEFSGFENEVVKEEDEC